jgi:exonuclease III
MFRRCWRHCNFIHNDSKGAAGGLAILWNPASVIVDQPFSIAGTLSTHYRAIGSNKEGVLTNSYGPQNNQEKDIFLNNLSYLGELIGQKRWILGGDFNIILTLEEKRGGSKWLDQDSGKFRDLIDHLKLIDIETRNGSFTWSNKCSGSQQIACRLDRFLIYETLMLEGPSIEASILPKSGSDHWPVQLWIDTIATPKFKPFRFEIFWLTHPDFPELSRSWWANAEISHGTRMYRFQQRLKNFKQQLHDWNKNVFEISFRHRGPWSNT